MHIPKHIRTSESAHAKKKKPKTTRARHENQKGNNKRDKKKINRKSC